MPRFAELAFTKAVRARQERHGSRQAYARFDGDPRDAELGPDEAEFVAERDHFFLGSVSETGWPYIQHRGGPRGFLKILGPRLLGFADYRGNRQYVSVGNLEGSDKVSLFLLDQANRRRLKLLGRARTVEAAAEPDLMAQLAAPGQKAPIERAFLIEVEAFDWNCPQHITPRYTAEEVATAVQPLRDRIAELEAELRRKAVPA